MIIVTGEKGQLSVAIREYLVSSGLTDTICMSVRGNDWEKSSFADVDAIIHVAGIVPKPGVNAEDFYVINRNLTSLLAKKAKGQRVKHFIYISSMAVYGVEADLDPLNGLVDDASPCNPTSDYGKSKLQAENELCQLEDNQFKIAIIRVPSIYSVDKCEYFEQYELICRKFRCIPLAFRGCSRSAISLVNLCELLRLVVINKTTGILCPDNGSASASDYCAMIHPEMSKSRIVGFCIENFLRWHPMVRSLFGALAYTPSASNLFDGAYRISR